MTTAEKNARKMIGEMKIDRIIDLWETTSKSNNENCPIVRGWLMDEIEKRYPEQFDKWLDGDAEDETLKNYILT